MSRSVLDGALEEGHSWLKSCTCKDRKESPHTEQTEQAIRSACAQGREERGWERRVCQYHRIGRPCPGVWTSSCKEAGCNQMYAYRFLRKQRRKWTEGDKTESKETN